MISRYGRGSCRHTENVPLRCTYTNIHTYMHTEMYYILIARVLGAIYIRHELTIDMVS